MPSSPRSPVRRRTPNLPPWPIGARAYHPALSRAAHTAAAVALLADLSERLPAELRRTLTVAELEAELARALAQLARQVAQRHLVDDTEPADGASLFERAVRRSYTAQRAARDAELEAEADRRLSALM